MFSKLYQDNCCPSNNIYIQQIENGNGSGGRAIRLKDGELNINTGT